MTGAELYAAMVEYLEQNGWQREEPGSAWWLHEDLPLDEKMGDAVTEQLRRDGIDTRHG